MKHLLVTIFIVILAGSCTLGMDGGSEEPSDGKTYEVKFEVTGTGEVTENPAAIEYSIGSTEGTSPSADLPWTKEKECGEDTHVELAAASDHEGSITVTIYINDEKKETMTGDWDEDENETGALVSTSTS